MNAEGHFIFALASAILVKKISCFPPLSQGDWWHIISGAVLTCLLPDLDHPKSLLGQRLFWLSVPIAYIFGHRGFTHSFMAIIAGILFFTLCLPQEFIPLDVYYAMIIGYSSHIMADILTPAGVPLLWPYRCRFRLLLFSSATSKQLKRLCTATLLFALLYPDNICIFQYLVVIDTIKLLWQRVYANFYISC
ncbi:metal-dependent hydrolase [Candidatus Hoaglandella endobia]|uniref:Inner membrane protein YdjM n=1 Tax=Candidatus Hoaglandella endobia TaxID=1778263 RepID=A0A143WU57_9ENTR|nr:metal-dependent hydrolase [Candidatus Hoaglandella endobia]CUX97277.1 Inner membrane protein YdjM [Candidatus Hoaglandella endobia]